MMNIVAGKPSIAVAEKSIQWAPIAAPVTLQFLGTSCEAVSKALQEAFGPFPIRLHKGEQLMILKGMAAAAGEGAQPYKQLMAALSQVGQLELTEL